MNTQTVYEHVIRQRFTARLKEWWQETDPDVVATAVDELMTDLGYTIKKPSLRKTDPELYRLTQREKMRVYMKNRRDKLKEAATVKTS